MAKPIYPLPQELDMSFSHQLHLNGHIRDSEGEEDDQMEVDYDSEELSI